jgi:glycosyltransferase involved in cell wall biosynthesis
VFHHRKLRPDENRAVLDGIEKLLRAVGSSRPVVIVSFPLWTEVAAELQARFGSRVVYDCHDLLAGFADISEDLLQDESRLLMRSDRVAFSSDWLRDHIVAGNPSIAEKAFILRNGVNSLDFQAALDNLRRVSPDVTRTIGYVGSLNFWFDVESVRRAARTHPEWRFVLIGRQESPNLELLRDLTNVVLLGEVPYTDLPKHLSEFDVAIMPFVRNPLTLATNPVKVYEYFACGLPVVSTRLPELEQFPELIYLADTPDEFVRQIEAAMDEDRVELRAARRLVAEQESWMARCLRMQQEF